MPDPSLPRFAAQLPSPLQDLVCAAADQLSVIAPLSEHFQAFLARNRFTVFGNRH